MSSGNRAKIEELETLARKNQWNKLEAAFRNIRRSDLASQDLINLAAMARRAYRLSFATYLLKPLVLTPNNQVDRRAQPSALSEFAICQIMLGGRKAAKSVLKSVPADNLEGMFAWTTLHFSCSEYEQAIPHLERYIAKAEDPYKKRVGELNLSACLAVTGSYQKAEDQLNELREYFRANNHLMLLANVEELQGQIHIYKQDWEQAEETLVLADRLMTNGNKLYSLFIKKWQLVCQIHRGLATQSHLDHFIEQAKKLDHYHSIREILFYWSLYNFNEDGLAKVYYGTPFSTYRKFVKSQTEMDFSTQSFSWNGKWQKAVWSKELRIEKNPLDNLSLSAHEQKLLELATEDFFEPRSASALFYGLFPDEFFDPDYSLPKTYKVIQRLNSKLKSSGVGIKLISENKNYRLHFEAGWAIPKPNPELIDEGLDPSEYQLKQNFAGVGFTRDEVMDQFSMKKATALRWLGDLRKKGMVEKIGQGPGSFYRLSS